MKFTIINRLWLLSFFFPSLVFGQETEKENTFSLSGQFRPRLEYRHGAFRPLAMEEEPAVLINNRLQLSMDYAYTDLIRTKITFRNVNVWGQADPVQIPDHSGNALSVFEGWADLKITKNLRAKIGRQTISLDDERIFGISDWGAGARSHDALSIYLHKNKLKVETYFAFNQNYNALDYNNNINNPSGNLYHTTGAQPYKWMQTVWTGYEIDSSDKVSFLFTNIGFQNALSSDAENKVYFLQTTGLNYFFDFSTVSGNLTGYYQFGKDQQGIKTSAYLLAIIIGKQVNRKVYTGIGTAYLSGNSFGKNFTINKGFQPLFGTNHKFYGHMDYFYAGNPHGNTGLSDSYLTVKYIFSDKTRLDLSGHLFHAAADIFVNNKKLSRNLGQEIDFHVSVKLNAFSELNAGYSVFFDTNELLCLKNVQSAKSYQNWAWFSINIHPVFFLYRF